MISREAALELLKQYNKDNFHLQHALTVEAVMKWYANELGYGDQAEYWGIIGLLLELRHPGTVGIMAISGTNLSPDGLDESFVAECRKIYEKSPDPLTALMLNEPHIDSALLHNITIPVLITAGEHDLIKAEETRRIAEILPQSALTIVENADHGSYVVNSEIMGELLIQFLEEHGC